MRLPVFAALAVALLALAGVVNAATIAGTAYTPDLQVAKYSLLLINTTPAQRVLLVDGTYNISVPKGTYAMRAYINMGGTTYEDELDVTVADERTYSYDFILFPGEGNLSEQIPAVDEELVFPEAGRQQRSSGNWIAASLLLAALVVLVILLARRTWWEQGTRTKGDAEGKQHHSSHAKSPEAAPVAREEEALAADLKSALAFIKEQGGRTTQKELRKHIPCSEAKLSMMLTELESKGRIEKIKKGRGNLIILK